MPWKETCAMDQRLQFIGDWLDGQYTKTDLCEFYGISRPTGDKWIGRYQQLGAGWAQGMVAGGQASSQCD
jgi:putative transposase